MRSEHVEELSNRIREVTLNGSGLKVISLLGPSGSGKTSFLKQLNEDGAEDIKPIFITAFRHIPMSGIRSTIDIEFADPVNFRLVNDFIHSYGPSQAVHMVIGDVIAGLYRKYQHDYSVYEKNLLLAVRSKMPLPEEPENPIPDIEQKLSRFIDFDAVNIVKCGDKLHLEAIKACETIRDAQLSDGEKMCLIVGIISIFLQHSRGERHVFLIDEPEIHLNENKAERLWGQFESEFPNAVFVYATHSVAFSTRSVVSEAYLMQLDTPPHSIDVKLPLPTAVVKNIVGVGLDILTVRRPILFCEDELHRMFCDDFLGDIAKPVRAGGVSHVIDAVRGNPGWESIRSSSVPVCGLIDRDSRDDVELNMLSTKGVFALPWNEIEPIFLIPRVSKWLLEERSGCSIEEDDVCATLLEAARKSLNYTLRKLANYVQENHRPTINFKLEEYYTVKGAKYEVPDDAILDESFIRSANKICEAAQTDVPASLARIRGQEFFGHFKTLAKQEYNVDLSHASQLYREIRSLPAFKALINDTQDMITLRQRLEGHFSNYRG